MDPTDKSELKIPISLTEFLIGDSFDKQEHENEHSVDEYANQWVDITTIVNQSIRNLPMDGMISHVPFDTMLAMTAIVAGNPAMDTNINPSRNLTVNRAIKNGLLKPLRLLMDETPTELPPENIIENDLLTIRYILEVMDGLIFKSMEFLCGWNSRIVTLGSCIYLHYPDYLEQSSPVLKLFVEGILIICEVLSRIQKIKCSSDALSDNRLPIHWSLERGLTKRTDPVESVAEPFSYVEDENIDFQDRLVWINLDATSHLMLLPAYSYGNKGALPDPHSFSNKLKHEIKKLKTHVSDQNISTKKTSRTGSTRIRQSVFAPSITPDLPKDFSNLYLALAWRLEWIHFLIQSLYSILSLSEANPEGLRSLMSNLLECHKRLHLIEQSSPFYKTSSINTSDSYYPISSTREASHQHRTTPNCSYLDRNCNCTDSKLFDDGLSRYTISQSPPIHHRSVEPKSFSHAVSFMSHFISSLFFLAPLSIVSFVTTSDRLYESMLLLSCTTRPRMDSNLSVSYSVDDGTSSHSVNDIGLSWCGPAEALAAAAYIIRCTALSTYFRDLFPQGLDCSDDVELLRNDCHRLFYAIESAVWGPLYSDDLINIENELFGDARFLLASISDKMDKHRIKNFLSQGVPCHRRRSHPHIPTYNENPCAPPVWIFLPNLFIQSFCEVFIPSNPFDAQSVSMARLNNTDFMESILLNVFTVQTSRVLRRSSVEGNLTSVVSRCFIRKLHRNEEFTPGEYWSSMVKTERVKLRMMHLSGDQKFDYGLRKDVNRLYCKTLRPIELSSALNSTHIPMAIIKQLEFVQHFLMSTGCYETGIFTDSRLSLVLWISSIVFLARAALCYHIQNSRRSPSILSHSSLAISLWLLFMHLNIKQQQRKWIPCSSCFNKCEATTVNTTLNQVEQDHIQAHWNEMFSVLNSLPLPLISLANVLSSLLHATEVAPHYSPSSFLQNILHHIFTVGGQPCWETSSVSANHAQLLSRYYHCKSCFSSNRAKFILVNSGFLSGVRCDGSSVRSAPLFKPLFEDSIAYLATQEGLQFKDSLMICHSPHRLFLPYLDNFRATSLLTSISRQNIRWVPYWHIPFPSEWKK